MFDVSDRPEQDEKEFEEWWKIGCNQDMCKCETPYYWAKEAWLSSRRVLRETLFDKIDSI